MVSSKLEEDFTSRPTKIRKSENCMEGVFKDHVKEIEFSKTPKISKHDTNDDNTVNEDTEAEKVRTMPIA